MNNEFKVGGFVRIIHDLGVGKIVEIIAVERSGVIVKMKNRDEHEYFKWFYNVEAVTDDEAMLYFLEN